MIHFSASIIIEFMFGLFLWWIAVYLFTQSPFNRLIQLISGIFVAMSFYLTSDILFNAALIFHQNEISESLFKSFVWSLYLPVPLFYHISFLLVKPDSRKIWQKILLYLAYLGFLLMILLETGTSIIRNYAIMGSQNFSGDFSSAIGKNFWIIGVFMTLNFVGSTLNVYSILKNQVKFSNEWNKYLWPFLGLCSTVAISPLIIASYYHIIPHSDIYTALSMILLSVSMVYSIVRYNFLIEDTNIVFGKLFIYSSLSILILLAVYAFILSFGNTQVLSVRNIIVPYLIVYLLFVSHPIYNWLQTFINDLVYNASAGFSIVNDEEVHQAVRNYSSPEKLENSTLLRLKAVEARVRRGGKSSVDALRQLTEEAIDYFKPTNDPNRRIKKNMKYHLLKMIAYDQAEEGQILWELGFDEYPVAIMSRETRERKPLFKTESPSDYYYTSRNAYLALKKEAIHDVTWRISYLEKGCKGKG